MKFNIVEEEDTGVYGRIEEIPDGEEITTCFICNADPDPELVGPLKYCCAAHRELHEVDDVDRADENILEFHPFRVLYRPEVGRYMVASRDLQPGEVIFSEEPLAMGPSHDALPCCLDCMKPANGFVCPQCQMPVCEEMCALGEEHAKECDILSQRKEKKIIDDFTEPSKIYWVITTLRCLHWRDADPEKYAIIQRMMDHTKEWKIDKESSWSMYNENVVSFLIDKCGLDGQYTEEEIFHALGVLDVNSVKINSGPQVVNGHGLYPLTSLLSHSCISNSKTVLKSDYSLDCKTTSFIRAGEEITKQYTSPLEPTQMRQEKLRSGWYFNCRCPRCLDPTEGGAFTSATRCLRCGDGTIMPNNPVDSKPTSIWKCQTCGHTTNFEAINKLVSYFLEKLKQPQVRSSVEALEDMQEKSARLLHPNHYVVTLVRIKMNVAYIDLTHRMFGEGGDHADEQEPAEVYMRRKELLDDIHKVIDLVDPGLSRRRGLSLFEMSTCHLQLGRLLYESERFPVEEFIQLINNEVPSLKEAIECLSDAREGTSENQIHYRAQCALHEAEVMQRLLEQKNKALGTGGAGAAIAPPAQSS